ncbi:hypothetical protein EDD86DRAFT_193504 [Gorgonomyces haynaldii]|nr:hypothetical protein EDD86DRAFT_193504 [Gorgonomyces haynaldii]
MFLSVLAATFCSQQDYCAVSTKTPDGLVMTLYGATTGWLAIGAGSSMSSSKMVIGYKNSTGGITLSARTSSAKREPTAVGSVQVVKTPATVQIPSWATLSFSFLSKQSDSGFTAFSDAYIWAMSPSAPTSLVDTNSAQLTVHSKRGSIQKIDFAADGPTAATGAAGGAILRLPSGFTYEQVVQIHAYMMIFAWVLMPLIGIYVARSLKHTGNGWFVMHIVIMVLGVFVVSLGAIALIYLYSDDKLIVPTVPHTYVGYAITGLAAIQMGLGLAAHWTYNPDRSSAPIIDRIHWWIGRVLSLGALANVALGILLYQESYPLPIAIPVAAGVALLIGIVFIVVGGLRKPKEEQDQESISKPYNKY